MYDFGYLTNGEWRTDGTETFQTFNPARPRECVGRYAATPIEAMPDITEAAAEAQQQWAALPPAERASRLSRFLDGVEKHGDDVALAITREQGKPLKEARGELDKALREARFMVSQASRASGYVISPQRPGMRNMILHRPRGVIAAITPWNFPVLTPMRKIAPALTFGNALIIKPSEFTPAAVALVAEIANETLPPGVLQVVQGAAEVGAALVSNARIDGVTFTGSVATGRRIYAAGATNLAEVSLELGGKNAAIIHDANDLVACLDQVAGAANQCAGQRCTAISRVIVQDQLSDAVIDGLITRAKAERLGDGMDETTTMGPLTNQAQMDRVAGYVAQGKKAGADIVVGGRHTNVAGCEGGYFFEPTVLSGVTPDMTVAREEIFGPVISVLSYTDFEQALGILNDVEFGLTSAIFSNNNSIIQRFLDCSENGMMHVNHGTVPDDHMPFGGVHNSGVGAYSVGASAANFYTTEHSAYIKYN